MLEAKAARALEEQAVARAQYLSSGLAPPVGVGGSGVCGDEPASPGSPLSRPATPITYTLEELVDRCGVR